MHRPLASAIASACLIAGAILLAAFERSETEGVRAPVAGAHPAGYVGAARCFTCHDAQKRAWTSSHHAASMQTANAATLLGRFDGSGAENGVFAAFTKGGVPKVRIEGADGKKAEFPVAFTFGIFPLQQYLAPFPGGRLQALPFAWDARPKEQGGQRWYSLYPGDKIAPGDPLHWTSRNQTWNSMCADCHSTGLRKNYDPATRTYNTAWSDMNVACEACHGPGAKHVAWAEGPRSPDVANKGITVSRGNAGGYWGDFDARGIRRWTGAARRGEIDQCGPCHTRRRALRDAPEPGQPLLDAHSPALIDDELYFADGQIKDEVFEVGSFLQSRMARANVVCTDCHDAHGGGLKASGNALCGQCHDAGRFDAPAHHRHTPGNAAAACVTCHMPSRTYMGVHVRHDHSFRLPAPARSAALGAPDPCLTCHADRGADWAEAALNRWGGGAHREGSGFAQALDAGRKRAPGAQVLLIAAAIDTENPPIARASAFALLARFPGKPALHALATGLGDTDALVRLGAVRGLSPYPPAEHRRPLPPLVNDPVRAVRIEAARLLAPSFDPRWPDAVRAAVKAALDEWIEAEQAASERPESALNLGALWAELGDPAKAEAAFRDALAQDPAFTTASIDLADLYRSLAREREAAAVLRQAVALAPDDADAHYALGLSLIRGGKRADALPVLARAAELRPANARFSYVYGLALRETGDRAQALSVLDGAHGRNPGDRDLLFALITISREAGDLSRARDYARALVALQPEDRNAAALLRQLEGGQ